MASMANSTLIGTMNMLGDAYNPFEFLAVDDAKFMNVCESFEARARAVTWADLDAQGLNELIEACGGAVADRLQAMRSKEAWAAMDDNALEDDNKFFDHRMNLIVFAMRRFDRDAATCADKGPLVWELTSNKEWWQLLKRCCEKGDTYRKSPSLLAWDLLCCVVASEDASTFAETCKASYLNPDNTERHAQIFVDAALNVARDARMGRCVLGLQEFPQAGTPRAAVFEAAFKTAGFEVVRAVRSCALVHKGFGSGGAVLADGGDASIGVDADAVMKTLTRDADGAPKYDKKTMAAFEGTTAAKVLSVRLDGVAYHALHAKEPKTPEAAELLAKFLAAHAAACGAGPFAWLVDTNLAKETTDSAFRREVEASGLQVSASVPTTSKRRSRLHGQCYDDNKCHKTVVAAKDKFVVTDGALTLLPTVPDLADEAHPVTLPRETWPADHALVAAVFAPAA